MTTILNVFSVLGGLAMFLYGMALMSEGLQKSAGDRLRAFMASMTSNAFKRVLTGTAVTALVQSSSATTIMVVSFVNAGLLTLGNAIGVIMGANIGTTLTAWITSLGFSVNIALFAVPVMGFGFVMHSSKKATVKNMGQFLMGFAIMYVGLTFMKDCSNAILDNYQTGMMNFFGSINGFGFGSVLLFLIAGAVLTIVLQASSATMAITMLLAASGLIDFKLAVAMVLGENIGTTITANIAAAVGNTSAKRAALAHTVFNLFGVIWALALYPYFLRLIGFITAGIFGIPNPAADGFEVIVEKGVQSDTQTSALYGLSMLHTLFNTINTLILIWFVPLIERIVCAVIKDSKKKEEEVFRLKYISAGPLATPELATEQALREIIHFAEISRNGLGYARSAINASDPDEFEEYRAKLVKYEEIADRIDYEIAAFLNAVSTDEISVATSYKIKAMYKIIGELESLGDSGETISRILSRRNVHKKVFDAETLKKLNSMVDLVDKAYEAMIDNLKAADAGTLEHISNANAAEDRINNQRNYLRDEEIESIESGSRNYHTSVYYMDVVNELEKMGDFIINISQDLLKQKVS